MSIDLDLRERRDAAVHSATALGPGLAAVAVGVGLSLVAHRLLPTLGVLTWAVLLGAVASNVGLLPTHAAGGIRVATKRLLRIGVVLLGFSLSLVSILALGLPMICLVVATLFSTLLATAWVGRRIGVGGPRSLLIATGFAICGASAIAAMEENAEADDDDVMVAIAMVTLCGTLAMVTLPLLQHPLGLTDAQYGVWAGASVHEVGQVVAAAGPAGASAVAIAVVVKLTRVLLLAPVVAGVSVVRRRRSAGAVDTARRPPVVPLFVLGFLACVLLRTAGVVPAAALGPIETVQTVALAAALFGMGTGVQLRSIVTTSGRAILLALASTLFVASVALTGVYVLM